MPKITVMTPSIRPWGLLYTEESLAAQTFEDFEWLCERGSSKKVDFNAAMNRMIKKAKGELIVSLQDYIKIMPTGLERFWKAYKNNPAFYTAPVGKTLDFENFEWDWREKRKDYEEVDWKEWEIDWGCAPRAALEEIGGFDEELDRYWGFDNVNVGFRAHLAGYDFRVLSSNMAAAYDHDKMFRHPFRDKRNPDFFNERLADIRRGLKINYLKK